LKNDHRNLARFHVVFGVWFAGFPYPEKHGYPGP